jgi:segregation and condensation protein A
MAARLLEIKSRWLLPKAPEREEDPEDLKNDLIRQLELYQQYKQACERLKDYEQQGNLVYYHLPEEQYREERVDVADMTLDMLVAAFKKMKDRLLAVSSAAQGQERIERDGVTVQKKVLYIRKRLLYQDKVSFFSLFRGASTREEVIVTFLALLEMVKNDLVLVEQDLSGKDIEIISRKEQPLNGSEFIPDDSGY